MIGECGVFVADNEGQNRLTQSRKTVVITVKQRSIKIPLLWKVHPITTGLERRAVLCCAFHFNLNCCFFFSDMAMVIKSGPSLKLFDLEACSVWLRGQMQI